MLHFVCRYLISKTIHIKLQDDDDDDDEAMSDDDSMSEDDADLVSVETTSSRRVTFSTPSEMADDEYESVCI